jgi:hypothetical protein
MKITVTGINKDEAVFVRGTSALGWRGSFGCPLVAGEAVFIAARSQEYNLRPGNTISVETSFDEVENVRIVADDADDSMVALDNPCDYDITGTVTFAAPQGIVVVSVRGLNFSLDRNELKDIAPKVGQHVAFELHRLTLWDTAT